MLGFGRDGGIGRRCGVGFFCGASSLFFLGALFSFGALLFQTFHFLLALLERDGHRASSQVRLTRVNNEDECELPAGFARLPRGFAIDRKSTRLNSSHGYISYAVFCLKKKNN